MNLIERFIKRSFDLIVSFIGLMLLWPAMLITAIIVKLTSGGEAFFRQKRVGRYGKIFEFYKFRTMHTRKSSSSSVTVLGDSRVTPFGTFLRGWKLDELPQLWNVLKGEMSFVGPRPDVQGYADQLKGYDRIILTLRPGITGPATLKYKNEEELLASQSNPERYNQEVIFPDKVRINRGYIENYRFMNDIRYIWLTIFGK
jgi:lipopolysaccharide/colanic/teichoic acid biosynthesis glycosyltransferase